MNNKDKWRKFLSVPEYFSGVWLVGSLFKAGKKTYAAALYEFGYLFVWSILPFGLAALTLYVGSAAPEKSFIKLGIDTFRNGELLVFTISMLAPILYLTLHEPEEASTFPHKLPISTAVALIVVTCAALFALLKANAVHDTAFVFALSVLLTAIALIFRFLALVYHRIRLPDLSERELRGPQTSFIQEYKAHVENEGVNTASELSTALAKHVGAKHE